jgi:hypothetical protein
MFVQDTSKTKAAYMTGLRTQWQTAKTKHEAAITAKKIKFDKGLGKLLTNRLEMYRGI